MAAAECFQGLIHGVIFQNRVLFSLPASRLVEFRVAAPEGTKRFKYVGNTVI
jgi:hypothetical protein